MSVTDISMNGVPRNDVSLKSVCQMTTEKDDSLDDSSLTDFVRRHLYIKGVR